MGDAMQGKRGLVPSAEHAPAGQQCTLCGYETTHSVDCPMVEPQDKSSVNQPTIDFLQTECDELRSQNIATREIARELAAALEVVKGWGLYREFLVQVDAALAKAKAAGLLDAPKESEK